jgi:dihydropteroate synthase
MTPRKQYLLKWGSRQIDFDKNTRVMGILNVTPDSFSDGGMFFQREEAIAQGELLAAQGADLLDIGGESARPFSDPISPEEEIRRIVPIIKALSRRISIPISVDTWKAEVAQAALDAGAAMVNDISGLGLDPRLGEVAGTFGVPLILMHMQGTPRDMQAKPNYNHLLEDIHRFFEDRVRRAEAFGLPRDRILIDPGIGFGKLMHHNLTLIKQLDFFQDLDLPIVLGTSRKSFVGKITQQGPLDRDWGTAATLAIGAWQGAHMMRVHNVTAAKQVLAMTDALREALQE